MPTIVSSLPTSPDRLIGRGGESRRIIKHLTEDGVRLITLSGVGGTGKTRLASEVARTVEAQYRDGARFVALAACREPGQVLSAILRSVAPGESAGSRLALDAVVWTLRGLDVLLVLDNFEQVLEAAPLVSELLAACPGLSVLATSRAPLRVKWEHELALGPLETPAADLDASAEGILAYPSVALLLERLRAAGVMTSADPDEAVAMASICRRLDGIPLAIELAAPRARLLGVRGLQARLERPLELLTGGPRDAPARHQALRMTFDWSYELLTDADKRVFRHLGVFVGGCTYELAAGVCDASIDDVDFLDALGRVMESGFVRPVEASGAAEPRLALLEPVREYALERLQACGEAHLAQQRHATAYLDLCERANTTVRTLYPTWFGLLDREHGNTLAALRWFIEQREAESSLRLAVTLSKFWWVRGFVREDLDGLDAALDLTYPEPASHSLRRARCAAFVEKASAMFYLGDYAAAETCVTAGLSLLEATDASNERAHALEILGNCTLAAGNLEHARSYFDQALTLHRATRDELGIARSTMHLGRVAWLRRDYTQACVLLTESALAQAAVGDFWSAAFAHRTLALVECYRGNNDAALARLREGLAIWRKVGGRVLLAQLLEAGAVVAVARRQYERGLRVAAAAAARRAEIDSPGTPTWLRELNRWLEQARQAIGREASSAAWTAGQALSVDAAVAETEADDATVGAPIASGSTSTREGAPAGLTAREVQILRLVARGSTNKEIASQLLVSVATVERHLANAYTKVGARGRAEATAFVITRGLLN